MNLLDFAHKMEKLKKEIPLELNKITIKFIEDLLFLLVTRTPVDTSEALSNWQVSLNSPIDSAIEAYFPGEKGDTQSESARAAHDKGRIVLQTKRVGNTVYISNLAEHIVNLNGGTSAQAPSAFVELSILEVERRLKNVKIELLK